MTRQPASSSPADAGTVAQIVEKVTAALHYPPNGHHYCRWCGHKITGGGDHSPSCGYVYDCERIDEAKQLLADLLASPRGEAAGWQPIEAYCGGGQTNAAIIHAGNDAVGEAWLCDGKWYWAAGGLVHHTPTHWMPLPSPPALSGLPVAPAGRPEVPESTGTLPASCASTQAVSLMRQPWRANEQAEAVCDLAVGHLSSHEGEALDKRWWWNETGHGIMRHNHPTTNKPLPPNPQRLAPLSVEAREQAQVFSDYWQCEDCGALLHSPTTGLAAGVPCWKCTNQPVVIGEQKPTRWRPVAKPQATTGSELFAWWLEARKRVVSQWPDLDVAAADILFAKARALLNLPPTTGGGSTP